MVYEVLTTLEGAEVLRRAKGFFAERVPMQAAFPEKEGPARRVYESGAQVGDLAVLLDCHESWVHSGAGCDGARTRRRRMQARQARP